MTLNFLQNGLEEWHRIFYVGASVYITCGIVFFIFGSAETQPWNKREEKSVKFDADSPEIKYDSTQENLQAKKVLD